MKFILFGAGVIGLSALTHLGEDCVECFADNKKYGSIFCGKRVISFDEMVEMAEDFRIVISTNDYAELFEQQLKKAGVEQYMFWPKRFWADKLQEVLPTYGGPLSVQYMSYNDVLSYYKIWRYKKIVIYGSNTYIDYLLMEIAMLNHLEHVIGIVDEEAKVSDYMGIPVRRLEEIGEFDCLIINKRRTDTNIRDVLFAKDKGFDILDIYNVEKFISYFHHPELKKFKDIHKGQRAFIIGNGPSLTVDDLNMLSENHEICFALNNIYKIFNQTTWRPDYLCLQDDIYISGCKDKFESLMENSVLFVSDHVVRKYSDNSDLNLVHTIHSGEYVPNMPEFSDDITKGIYTGFTSLYSMALQIAAYMGFDKMYLLGVDNNYSKVDSEDQNHFVKGYFSAQEKEEIDLRGGAKNMWKNDGVNLAYCKAEVYSEANGFKIYNATRGGKLEVFERVNFDTLF